MGKHRAREREHRSAGVRGPRLEQLFREELNSIIDCEISDPRLEGARVNFVELSRDGSRARVWFALASDSNPEGSLSAAELETAFERAAAFLRRRLCEALPLKRMPELCFRHDLSLAELGEPLEQT